MLVGYLEKPGNPILAGLAPNNPFKDPNCQKPDCPLPPGHCQGKCSKENILYVATCNICQSKQEQEGTPPDSVVHRQYIGETSRTLRVRANQHKQDLLKCSRNQNLEEGTSWMWDHLLEAHGPQPNINPGQDFSFNLFQTFKDPMSRQLSEAVRIQVALNQGTHQGKDGSSNPIISLNRKNEFFCQRMRFTED